MTPEEFTTVMLNLQHMKDVEDRHRTMDELMCNLLRQLGYGDGIDVFKKIPKWYA